MRTSQNSSGLDNGATPLPPVGRVASVEQGEIPRIRQGIVGRVVDASNGEAIIDGTVSVVGISRRAVTDVDGNFAIELPPGRYTLRAYYDLYSPRRIERVVVRAGQVTRVEVRLEPARNAPPASVGETVISARADTSTAATTLEMRRQSVSVSDTISAEEISRSPDTNASDSIRRVVGASLVDGQYAYVRGLGGRYVNVLLNGVPLPPLDPDVPGVQLDLFPASLLESMSLVKSFTPDIPGDFAGGSLQIATREFPSRLTLQSTFTIGADTLTHTSSVLRARGGALDWLGFDDGTRALPASVPQRFLSSNAGVSREDLASAGRALPNSWNVGRFIPAPNYGLTFSVGDTVRLRGRPLGYLFNLAYSSSIARTIETVRSLNITSIGPQDRVVYAVRETLQQESTSSNVLWGALGTIRFQPAPNHEIGTVMMWSQSATDAERFRTGYNETQGADVIARQIRWVQRSLAFGQIVGDHRELPLRMRLRWQLFGAYSARSEPDTRQLAYQADAEGTHVLLGAGNVARIYSGLAQIEGGGNVDLALPMGPLTLRAGGMVRMSDRAFTARRFTYDNIGLSSEQQRQGPEAVFAPEHLGTGIELEEFTGYTDGYRAIQQLYAPFARIDIAAGPLRVVGGARVESFRQWVRSTAPFPIMGATPPSLTDRSDVDVLPAASLTWALSQRMNLRAAYGGTVARPLIRELAPFRFDDFVRNRSVQGNPSLRSSFVHNFDLRWELFPGPGEVLAVSLFYKHFINPIEQVFLNREGSVSFDNAAGATNIGAEFEARLSMRRIAPALAPLAFGANLSLIYSQVTLRADQVALNTNQSRPLAGQSPFLANVMVGWAPERSRFSAYFYYNVHGPRIEDVGRFDLQDVYQQTRHQLDATLIWEPVRNFSLRLIARNLLLQPTVLRQGETDVQVISPATSLALRAAWNY